jgi:hypothetical protein
MRYYLIYSGEEGLYCSSFRNPIGFSHLTRNTRIFCRLRPVLSSLISLSIPMDIESAKKK